MFIAQKDPLLQIPLPYTGCGMFDYIEDGHGTKFAGRGKSGTQRMIMMIEGFKPIWFYRHVYIFFSLPFIFYVMTSH